MNRALQRVRRLACEFAPRWLPTLGLALLICAATYWIWRLPRHWYRLKLDDFVYVARSRSMTSLRAQLLTPHNGHVVPLFLCETHLLSRVAGTLEALPGRLGWAAHATLLMAMAAGGHVVAWETGRPARGLAAMAAIGFSSVLGPAVLWYSASQALAAGTVILLMLVMLQGWRAHGSTGWLVGGTLAAVAAPLFWSAGFIAGLVGTAYLWADGRRFCRIASAAPIAASLLTAAVVWGLAGHDMLAESDLPDRSPRALRNLPIAMAHSTQAICEKLVLNNLGLDAPTSAPQAIVLSMVLAGAWAWSRGLSRSSSDWQRFRINPLEAAGAVLVIANFGMIFAVRGTETTFGNLRALGWYDAIPQLGAVLFAAGWWTGDLDSSPAQSIGVPKPRELAALLLFVIPFLLLQAPRIERVIFAYDGLSARIVEEHGGNNPRVLSFNDLAEQSIAQCQALAQLDTVERSARQRRIDPGTIRSSAGRVIVPGMPENVEEVSSFDLLDIPKIANPPGNYGR